jgi:TM2 domain-containing membrane protein YozV
VTFRSEIGFALLASVVAALGAAALLPWFWGGERAASVWAARGFLAMAVPGIVGGAWLVREHGRSAQRFLVALATGFITRLILAGLAAFYAGKAGDGAATALLSGLAAGFVPLMAFEMIWFARARGARGLGTEPRG